MGFAGSDACRIALFHVILVRLLRDKIRSALMTELSGYFTTEQLGGDSYEIADRAKELWNIDTSKSPEDYIDK